MVETAAFKIFLQYGIVGAVALIAMIVAWRKDQALQAEKDARLADAKEYLKMYHELAKDSEATLESAVSLIVRNARQALPLSTNGTKE